MVLYFDTSDIKGSSMVFEGSKLEVLHRKDTTSGDLSVMLEIQQIDCGVTVQWSYRARGSIHVFGPFVLYRIGILMRFPVEWMACQNSLQV